MILSNLPDDINIELLFSYFPEGSCKASFRGLHKRNAYADLVDIEKGNGETVVLGIGRNSLYDVLPEYMFHPIDRFNNLPSFEEKERFAEELEKQEREKECARRFFAPIDAMLLKLRIQARERFLPYSETNKVLIDILADELSPEQKKNRFIKRLLPLLPSCKYIRGNKTLMTLMLRKVFIEEGLKIEIHTSDMEFTDTSPRYEHSLDSNLGDCFVGNIYDQSVNVYDIHYWNEDECNEQFHTFVGEMELLRAFIQDYFMSIDEVLTFNISHDGPPLRLNDDVVFNYLNYNTNI